jgi:hypothetical protein
MKSGTLETLKMLLWVILGIFIIIFFGYFVKAYVGLNDKKIALDTLSGRLYGTTDYTLQLTFSDTANEVTWYEENVKTSYLVTLDDNILTLSTDSGESVHNLIIIDSSTLFSDTGNYLYYYDE